MLCSSQPWNTAPHTSGADGPQSSRCSVPEPCEPYYHQLATKAKDWEYEQEVRLIIPKPNPEYDAFTPEQAKRDNPDKVWNWKEIRHYFPISDEGIKCIYIGANTPEEDKTRIINYVRKNLNPNIKIYQMQVDDAAFRLKAVEIK